MKYFQLIAALALSLLASAAKPQDAPGSILFTNVNVFDGHSPELIENANVMVEGNLITAVSTEPLAAANAQIIDGGGRTLMPGLIDQHVHYSTFLPLSDTRVNMHPYAHGALALLRAKEFLMNGYTPQETWVAPRITLERLSTKGWPRGRVSIHLKTGSPPALAMAIFATSMIQQMLMLEHRTSIPNTSPQLPMKQRKPSATLLAAERLKSNCSQVVA